MNQDKPRLCVDCAHHWHDEFIQDRSDLLNRYVSFAAWASRSDALMDYLTAGHICVRNLAPVTCLVTGAVAYDYTTEDTCWWARMDPMTDNCEPDHDAPVCGTRGKYWTPKAKAMDMED